MPEDAIVIPQMRLKINLIGQQVLSLTSFGRSYAYYRAFISRVDDAEQINRNFIKQASTCFVKECLIQWCIVFGSPKNNNLHYKNTTHYGALKEINTKINSELGYQQSKTNTYMQSVKKFRDRYIAHTDITPEGRGRWQSLPYLEPAFTIANTYTEWLIAEIPWGQPRQESLRELRPTFEAEANRAIEKFLPPAQ
ncbi:hypothetical protein [Desulfovibrio subterraneus]|uniref:HEPN AbiU2-like domain-containing protein n=1 Tax=Desulfovibrio subterraneus TaxID=2718620 RepID=A0A7J0BKC8_9BACT|nr:hypothetical protein [Desulfovibrio subterraneus]GFM34187.1 hypothetical protein DSM101010T_25520 [Desulfovibrio subterraneus]